MKIKRSLNAFTMIELLAGIFLTTIAAGAIIVGSVHARKTINDIRLKQLAYEKLKSHTEFWKGKVAAGDIPSILSNCDDEICLKEDQNNDCVFYASELCYDLEQPDIGDSNARRWELITTIKWDNVNKSERELSFYVIQMVF
tara:strand:- start:1300 stop:1725 length:426 start_codon:yes stop_codon:yes gene_type:complete